MAKATGGKRKMVGTAPRGGGSKGIGTFRKASTEGPSKVYGPQNALNKGSRIDVGNAGKPKAGVPTHSPNPRVPGKSGPKTPAPAPKKVKGAFKTAKVNSTRR